MTPDAWRWTAVIVGLLVGAGLVWLGLVDGNGVDRRLWPRGSGQASAVMKHLIGFTALILLAIGIEVIEATFGVRWAVIAVLTFDVALGCVLYRALKSGQWTSDRGC